MRATLWLVAAALLGGCSVSGHAIKHRYWVYEDGFAPLPAADVIAERGYISYPLLFARKQLFAEVSDGCDDNPIDIRVRQTRTQSPGPGAALPWILVSGSSVFLIPYRSQSQVVTEFTVVKDGAPLRTFRYEDTKTTWLSFFAFLSLAGHDEYTIEEKMADQAVNSFILDLLKDEEVMAQLRPAPAAVAGLAPSSGTPAAATPPRE